jgi:hypothetical protein
MDYNANNNTINVSLMTSFMEDETGHNALEKNIYSEIKNILEEKRNFVIKTMTRENFSFDIINVSNVKKDENNIKNKNEEQIIYKKIANLFFTSCLNHQNNSVNKNNIKKKEKIKIGMENNNSNVIPQKLKFKSIPKQKSSTNIIYKNKKKYISIKHKNIIKKKLNSNSNKGSNVNIRSSFTNSSNEISNIDIDKMINLIKNRKKEVEIKKKYFEELRDKFI